MTKLLQKALESVRTLSPAEQDEIARMMLAMSEADAPEPIDPAHHSAVMEGLQQVRGGEFATDDEIASVLRRFDA